MLCDRDVCVYYPDGTCYCPDAGELLMTAATAAAAEAVSGSRNARATDVNQVAQVTHALTRDGAPDKIVIVVSRDVALQHRAEGPRPAHT